MDNNQIYNFEYLKELKINYSQNIKKFKEIVYIIGNSSCDMDSALCSFLLSLGKNIKNKILIYNKDNSQYKFDSSSESIYVPVLNCQRGTFEHRLDAAYVFEKNGINIHDFIYINDNEFTDKFLDENKERIKIILVDHSVLPNNLLKLSDFVIEIFDHHLNNKFDFKNLKKITMQYPLGSCTTLILNNYFIANFPYNLISPLFAISAILIDTYNFADFYYENRWVDLDKVVCDKLIEYANINADDKDHFIKDYFSSILNIKYNVEKNLALGLEVLLNKDMKIFEFNNVKAVWSAFQVPYLNIIEHYGIDKFIIEMNKIIEKEKKDNDNKHFIYVTNSEKVNTLFTIYISKSVNLNIDLDSIKDNMAKLLDKRFISFELEDKLPKDKGIIIKLYTTINSTRKNTSPIFSQVFSNLN